MIPVRRQKPKIFKWKNKETKQDFNLDVYDSNQEDSASALSYHSVQSNISKMSESVREFINNVEDTFDTMIDNMVSTSSSDDDDDSDSDFSDSDSDESNDQDNSFTKRVKKVMSPAAIQKKMTQSHTPKYSNTPREQNSTSQKNENKTSFFDLGQPPSFGFYNWSSTNEIDIPSRDAMKIQQGAQDPQSTKSLPTKRSAFKFGRKRSQIIEEDKPLGDGNGAKLEDQAPFYFPFPSSTKSLNAMDMFNFGSTPQNAKIITSKKSTGTKHSARRRNVNQSPSFSKGLTRTGPKSRRNTESDPLSSKAWIDKTSAFSFGRSIAALKLENTDAEIEEPTKKSNRFFKHPLSTKSAKSTKQSKSLPQHPSSTKSLGSFKFNSLSFGRRGNKEDTKNFKEIIEVESPLSKDFIENLNWFQTSTPKNTKSKPTTESAKRNVAEKHKKKRRSTHKHAKSKSTPKSAKSKATAMDKQDKATPKSAKSKVSKNGGKGKATPKSAKSKATPKSAKSKASETGGKGKERPKSAKSKVSENGGKDKERPNSAKSCNNVQSCLHPKSPKSHQKQGDHFDADVDSLATPEENKSAIWYDLMSYIHESKVPQEITIESSLKKNRFGPFSRTKKGRGKNAYAALS